VFVVLLAFGKVARILVLHEFNVFAFQQAYPVLHAFWLVPARACVAVLI